MLAWIVAAALAGGELIEDPPAPPDWGVAVYPATWSLAAHPDPDGLPERRPPPRPPGRVVRKVAIVSGATVGVIAGWIVMGTTASALASATDSW